MAWVWRDLGGTGLSPWWGSRGSQEWGSQLWPREEGRMQVSAWRGVSPLEALPWGPWGCPEEREPELLLRVGRRLWSGGAAPFPRAAAWAWSAVDSLDQTRFSRAYWFPSDMAEIHGNGVYLV